MDGRELPGNLFPREVELKSSAESQQAGGGEEAGEQATFAGVSREGGGAS